MNAKNRLRVIDKVSRSEALLNQPTGILTTNSKMSNIFLHTLQAIDLVGEKRRGWGSNSGNMNRLKLLLVGSEITLGKIN